MISVTTALAADGGLIHAVSQPASRLPGVAKRDIEQAWEAAQQADPAPPPRIFLFPAPAGPPEALHVADKDAAAWAAAVETVFGLSTAHGVAVCLRLLGLIALIGQAAWARPYFNIGRGGGGLSDALLLAAAQAPLTDTGGFDEPAFRALLPPA